MDTKQPEALRLADALEYCDASVARQAINELRSLHARITELEGQLSAIGAIDMNTQHIMELADMYAHAKVTDDCPPEKLPRNFMKASVEAMEAAHLRELAAYRLTVENLEREIAAQQPAPSAATASKAVLAAIRAANMQLVRTGDDEFMLVTYKNAKAQCDGGKCGIGGYCDDCPTAQADTQPAHQWDVGYPPLPEQLSFDALVSAPGCAYSEAQMRAYVDADRAARAPADSVTAPAGDAARLDFLIEQQAYVVSDPDACPGHWLHWPRPNGGTWGQGDEHPTPRAAIDAARKQGEKQ